LVSHVTRFVTCFILSYNKTHDVVVYINVLHGMIVYLTDVYYSRLRHKGIPAGYGVTNLLIYGV